MRVFLSGLNKNIFFSSTQIKCYFQDSIGNTKTILGTGFAVVKLKAQDLEDIKRGEIANPAQYFITNRHNLDPSMKLGNDTKFNLSKVEILFRKKNKLPTFEVFSEENETKFIEIPKISDICFSENADVAVIHGDFFQNAVVEGYGLGFIPYNDIAQTKDYSKYIRILGEASFIGYPAINGKPLWDTKTNLPIARQINIASYPYKDFENSEISTSNVRLVSGLSFSGSSGSIVVSHLYKYPDREELVLPKVIGIMSGHFKEDNNLEHSGLSYFTTTEPIFESLDEIEKND